MPLSSVIELEPGREKLQPAANSHRYLPIPDLIAMFAIGIYLVLASCNLRYPGIYFDEALFINASLGGHYEDSFIAYRIFGVPVMTMQYIGALKSLLYTPIFALFGVNPSTIRVPSIIFSAATIWMIYLLLRRLTPRMVAAIATLFLAVDASFVLHTRADHGPIVLMLLLKTTALYALIRAIQNSSWRFFSLATACLTLGVWDKLNFVWIILGLVPSCLVYWRPLLKLFKEHTIAISSTLAISISVIAFFYFEFMAPLVHKEAHNLSPETLLSRWNVIYPRCQDTLSGQFFCNWVFQNPPTVDSFCPPWIVPMAFSIGTAAYLLCRKSGQVEELEKYFAGLVFYSVISAVIFLEILITPEAGGPHHIMVIWPLPYFVVLMSILLILKAVPPRLTTISSNFILALIIGIGIQHFAITTKVISMLKSRPLNKLWSAHIYELARFVQSHSNEYDCIVSSDWGIHNELSALVDPNTRKKCRDIYWALVNIDPKEPGEHLLTDIFTHFRVMVISYKNGSDIYPITRQRLISIEKMSHLVFNKLPFDDDSTGIYELYSLEPNPPSASASTK